MDKFGTDKSERETLKKHEIIRGHNAVKTILDNSIKKDGKYVIVFYQTESKSRKIGFLVSKKYKKAVQRNKLKRWMREIYRKNKQIFPKTSILLYCKFMEPLTGYQEIKNDILTLLKIIRYNDQ